MLNDLVNYKIKTLTKSKGRKHPRFVCQCQKAFWNGRYSTRAQDEQRNKNVEKLLFETKTGANQKIPSHMNIFHSNIGRFKSQNQFKALHFKGKQC